MRNAPTDWQVYRTRFLIRARQLTEPLAFIDILGREHQGSVGDYLVESSDGFRRIAPRQIFEDIYVAMGPAEDQVWATATARDAPRSGFSQAELNRCEHDRRRPTASGALLA